MRRGIARRPESRSRGGRRTEGTVGLHRGACAWSQYLAGRRVVVRRPGSATRPGCGCDLLMVVCRVSYYLFAPQGRAKAGRPRPSSGEPNPIPNLSVERTGLLV
jgi:hypothetical protein